MKKVIAIAFGLLSLCIIGLVIFILSSWDKKFEAPLPDFTASTDSATIARGKHLVFGPAHCATCHVPMDKIIEVENGLEIPLSGGWELSIPPGTFRAPNLTPDEETGIGSYSDAQLARSIRYAVKHDDSYLFPFMPFQELSDDDLKAIISYLRSQEPVKNKVEPSQLAFLGKALMAFGVLKPVSPKNPPKSVTIEASVEYGRYLAIDVANCRGCHTERDLKTGDFIGPDFGGGMSMSPDDFSQGYGFVTPNLSPDSETGQMRNWTEEQFITRFKGGRTLETTPMPWGAYSRMDTIELQAIYRYLQTVEPVNNKIDKVIYAPGEEMPE